jgi:hypothetical protein
MIYAESIRGQSESNQSSKKYVKTDGSLES